LLFFLLLLVSTTGVCVFAGSGCGAG
jgi:hypothetical protein